MKYSKELTTPIKRKRMGLLADDEIFQLEAKRIVDEMFAKLPALATAHGVPANDWFALALALAKEHVPGFKVVNPAGRPPEWTELDKAEFKIDIDKVRDASGKSVDESMKLVIRHERWATKTGPMKIEAMRQHYYNADERLIRIMEDAKRYEALLADRADR